MSSDKVASTQMIEQRAAQDLIREIVYQIRRLMQAGELYTKELSKTYQVSAPQLHRSAGAKRARDQAQEFARSPRH
jgi:hypothetical protein